MTSNNRVDAPSGVRDCLNLLRVQQWIKNLFIFLPLFFSLRIAHLDLLEKASFAFLSFCLLSSGVYILNDLSDLESDRLHPRKKFRPLASGAVSKPVAASVMVSLLLSGLLIAWLLGFTVFLFALTYLAMNVAYSLKLKHFSIIDIAIIAMGFVIRIFVGGAVTDTKIYVWIVVMTFLLALFIALAKRRNDVLIYMETNAKVRKVVDGYNLTFIDSAMMVMAAVILVSYIMYTVAPEVALKFNTDKLYLTSVFVVLGIFRYMQVTFIEGNGGSPTEVFYKDRFIQLCIVGWFITFAVLIYQS